MKPGPGRFTKTRPGEPLPLVMTPREAAHAAFQKSQRYFATAQFQKLYASTFPKPRGDGLYQRAAVEAWVVASFGGIAASSSDVNDAIMEAARGGARPRETRPRS